MESKLYELFIAIKERLSGIHPECPKALLIPLAIIIPP